MTDTTNPTAQSCAVAPIITKARKVSVSQAKRYQACAQGWFYSAAGYPARLDAARIAGTAVHQATMAALIARKNGIHAGAAELRDFTRERFRAGLEAAQLVDAPDAEQLADGAAACTAAYFAPGSPGERVEAEACEERVEISIPRGPAVIGFVDIRTTSGEVIDLKLSKRRVKPADAIADNKLQLATYAAATGTRKASIHTIVKTKIKTPAVLEAPATITDSDLEHMARLYRTIQLGMLSGIYPTNRTHYLCKRRFCDYWDICEKENGGEVRP